MTLKAGVVLVHGFFSSKDVWKTTRSLIETDGALQAKFDVLLFEYSSPRVVLNPARRVPSIDAAADSLMAFIEEHESKYERFVLIGHSQGGLVIQRMLGRALGDGRGPELATIRRVVLFACPNSGSEFLLSLRRGLWWIYRNGQERELRPLSKEVAACHRRIINSVLHASNLSESSCPIPFAVYAGESDNIVYQESANGMFPSARALPGDHNSIIQPHSSDSRMFVALRKQLELALAEPAALTLEEQERAQAAAKEQYVELTRLTDQPISIRIGQGAPTRFHVHAGPVEKLTDIDILVSPENSYMQMAHFFRPSISGRLRRHAAERTEAGEIVRDVANDELNEWMRTHARYGMPVAPGTVAATSAGELSSQNIRRIYHAAIALPRDGEREYDVQPNTVSRVVHEVFTIARKEKGEGSPRSSICFPLLGAGSGGLDPMASFARLWAALEEELRDDETWEIHFIEWRREYAQTLVATLQAKS